MAVYPIMSEKSGQRIANALERLAGVRGLDWDEEAGAYTNQSVAAMLADLRDGLTYGVSIPKTSAVGCTKFGANAGIANPTPGYVGHPAIDPYAGLGPFRHFDVNGYVDADGTPHVTAIEGDGRFRRDGSNGNVWVLAPVLWWIMDESGESSVTISVSDTRLSGMSAQPQAYLPDGTLRPYMLYAKYFGSDDGNGKMVSVSGGVPWTYTVSHNALITSCQNATTGYSAKSIADDWYVKTMFMLKYATKNSQSVYYGCNDYNYQIAPTVAETGVTRVIVSKANAANLIVGSSMMLGTHTSNNNDRNQSYNHDTFTNRRIIKIEDYDANNSAVYMDGAGTFNTHTTDLFSTAPWVAGSLDEVEGDGTITQAGTQNKHEPCKIQGIELFVGALECLGDVILKGRSESGFEVCVNYDSRNEATSLTNDYTTTGTYLEASSSNAHHYPLYPHNAGGVICGQGTGASQSTGLCDSQYTYKQHASAEQEYLGLGYLSNAANAGIWYVSGAGAVGTTYWSFGSRLSATGRGRAA